ncbi:MAG: hypothetical protein AUG01_01400 [Candidatus Rokubacteria bacterium 13_1_20CM_2_69_58]|nr:MAG: hypothetical protein AUG01_01400 [Candidatus Rokubacteria bacterium 13_1_20CM_2_69_58]
MPSRGLDEYRQKRDPARTPEPFGDRRPAEGHLFVVHKHSARRLHYDLRLEIDGVLAHAVDNLSAALTVLVVLRA